MSVGRFLRIARQRLRSLFRRSALDSELDRELTFHLEQLVREKEREGLPPAAARRAAKLALGNITAFEDACRDERRVSWLHDLGQDAAYGLRLLRKRPAFTGMGLAALALGIGANAVFLSAIAGIRFGRLPFPDADRLVTIQTVTLDKPALRHGVTILEYLAWKDRNRSFDTIGASLGWQSEFGAEANGAPAERVAGQTFTPSLFTALQVKAELGRVFALEDFKSGPPFVIVISHELWQRRFGGDLGIIDRRIRIDGGVRTVVGVMPPNFLFQDRRVDFWIPMLMNPKNDGNPSRLFGATAHLRPGVTIADAQADLETIAKQLAMERPELSAGWTARAVPFRTSLYGWAMAPLLTLEGAAALFLAIACANVAGLVTARGAVRRRELAVRAALGAARGRLTRQLLVESVLLALGGGLCGLPIAWIGLKDLSVVMSPPDGSPALAMSGLGWVAAMFAMALSVVAGVVMGLAPAVDRSMRDVMRGLREPAPAADAPVRHPRWRDWLTVGQLAVAVVLLAGAGLLLSSYVRLQQRDLHFTADGLLTLEFKMLERYTHPARTSDGGPPFEMNPPPSLTLQRVHDALRSGSGATAVAGISYPILGARVVPQTTVAFGDQSTGQPRTAAVPYFLVTPDFFTTIGATLLEGRDIADRDGPNASWIAVVNETTARTFWPGETPIGKHVTLGTMPGERPREIVGVVRDVPLRLRQTTSTPVIYTSYLQQPSRSDTAMNGMFGQMAFVLRGSGDPMILLPAAARAVATVDPDRPLTNIGLVADARSTPELRAYVLVLGAMAWGATLLAALGLCGVVVHTVNQRTREIGIRRALGAGGREILALFGGRALGLVAAGWAIGVAGAGLVTRLLAPQLWGVAPTDPATFATVSTILVLVALVACAWPLWRAVRIDPTIILRQE